MLRDKYESDKFFESMIKLCIEIEPVLMKLDELLDDEVYRLIRKEFAKPYAKTNETGRNSAVIRQNVIEEVRKLKQQPGKNIYVDGSSMLVHTLAHHNLVNEYSLLVYPLVLASGKRVFPDGLRVDMKLIETRQFPTGVVLQRYAVNNA